MAETVSLADRLALAVEMYKSSGFDTAAGNGQSLDAGAVDAAGRGEESATTFLTSALSWDEPTARMLTSENPDDYLKVVANLRTHRLLLAAGDDGTPFVALRSASEVDEELLGEIVAMLDTVERRPPA